MVRDFAVSRSLQPWCKEDRKWVPTPAACHPERSEGSRLEIFPRRLSEPDFSRSLPWAVRARFFASLRFFAEFTLGSQSEILRFAQNDKRRACADPAVAGEGAQN